MSTLLSLSSSSLTPYIAALLVIATAFLVATFFLAPASLHRRKSSIPSYRAPFPGLGPISLFERRNTFLRSVFGNPESFDALSAPTAKGAGAVRFNARNHIVTVSANADDRKTFFHDRTFEFNKAYETLFAGIPDVPQWLKGNSGEPKGDMGHFSLNLKKALDAERMRRSIPLLADYIVETLEALPAAGGEVDCHETIYPLIFRLSLVGVGMKEQYESQRASNEVMRPFWSFVDNSGFMQTMFPLVLVPSTLAKWKGTINLAVGISKLVEARKKEGRVEDDYPQQLIDRGVSTNQVVEFIMGSLFAAVVNTTGVTSYLLLFTGAHAQAQDKVRREFQELLDAVAEQEDDKFKSLPLREQLARIPLEMLEDGARMPYYEATQRETMRLLLNSVLFRYKSPRVSAAAGGATKSTTLSGEAIQPNEYAGFWLSSIHYNARIFSNPTLFDPDRWLRGEGQDEGDFLAWGTGNHPCLGMRFAKLEMKVTHAAWFLAMERFDSVDERGNVYRREEVPKPEIDSEHRRRPQKPVLLRYAGNGLARATQ
ncbi:hypothetical protein ACQY0O_007935 [Thecaphora frezii]